MLFYQTPRLLTTITLRMSTHQTQASNHLRLFRKSQVWQKDYAFYIIPFYLYFIYSDSYCMTATSSLGYSNKFAIGSQVGPKIRADKGRCVSCVYLWKGVNAAHVPAKLQESGWTPAQFAKEMVFHTKSNIGKRSPACDNCIKAQLWYNGNINTSVSMYCMSGAQTPIQYLMNCRQEKIKKLISKAVRYNVLLQCNWIVIAIHISYHNNVVHIAGRFAPMIRLPVG